MPEPAINKRYESLRKRPKEDVMPIFRQTTRLDMGGLGSNSKTDLIYGILGSEFRESDFKEWQEWLKLPKSKRY